MNSLEHLHSLVRIFLLKRKLLFPDNFEEFNFFKDEVHDKNLKSNIDISPEEMLARVKKGTRNSDNNINKPETYSGRMAQAARNGEVIPAAILEKMHKDRFGE